MGAEKIKGKIEDTVREFISELSPDERAKLLQWSEKALVIRQSQDLSTSQKMKALSQASDTEVAKVLLLRIFSILKDKLWTNQSWTRRLGFAGATAGLTFGGTAVGIATMGAGIGVPLMVMSAAGGVILGAAIDELKKEL